MRFSLGLLTLFVLLPAVYAQDKLPPAETDPGPELVVQKLFDAMAARNPEAAKGLFAADAALFSLGTDGQPRKMPLEEFLHVMGASRVEWKERIWNKTVLLHTPIAVVWAPYDFHLGGAFNHCGYDSISLMKTASGWKITHIADTSETSGCTNPLGPPR